MLLSEEHFNITIASVDRKKSEIVNPTETLSKFTPNENALNPPKIVYAKYFI